MKGAEDVAHEAEVDPLGAVHAEQVLCHAWLPLPVDDEVS